MRVAELRDVLEAATAARPDPHAAIRMSREGVSGPRSGDPRSRRGPGVVRRRYSPLYECSPLNQSDPEYVTITIPNATTSSSAAGRPAHERWLRAWR